MKSETELIEKADESNPNSESYINKVEVARRMNIKVRTVDNWMRRKFIPYYKLGHTVLFRWSEIENHIGKNCRVLAHGQQAVPAPIGTREAQVWDAVERFPTGKTGAHGGVSTRPQFQTSIKEKTNDRK